MIRQPKTVYSTTAKCRKTIHLLQLATSRASNVLLAIWEEMKARERKNHTKALIFYCNASPYKLTGIST